ncbi:MAG: hypothetical protein ACLR0N_04355 [Bilophila wadsworthia]
MCRRPGRRGAGDEPLMLALGTVRCVMVDGPQTLEALGGGTAEPDGSC